MNSKIPIFIAATIGLCILTTSISANSANARNTFDGGYFGGMGNGGYGGMGYGGAGPVIQEPVDTGNPHLDKTINKFYNCLSDTHEDPPTVQKVDDCYHQTVGSNGGTQT
ncbi:MAG: hypothetical protein WA323_01355 [Candidatus Nitrosopolaris sp.]